MSVFAALDMSQEETEICVVDQDGGILAEAKVPTCPDAIAGWLVSRAEGLERVGMETGPLAVWLWNALTARQVPLVCLDARHASASTLEYLKLHGPGQIHKGHSLQGMGVVLARRLCFTRRDRAWKPRPPAGISNLPVSEPSSAITGRTLRLCSNPRRAMSSASSSTEMPAVMRLTLTARDRVRQLFSLSVVLRRNLPTGPIW